MYTVTYTHTRPNVLIKFFVDANEETKALVARVVDAAQRSPGYVGLSSTMSPDGLTNTVVVTWADESFWQAHEIADLELLDEYRSARIAYNAVVGNTTETTNA